MTLGQLFAFSLTGGLIFLYANLLPLLSVNFKGLHNQISLWQSVVALAQGEITPMALVAGLAIILAPGLQIFALIWVLLFANLGHRRAPGFRLCLRTLAWLRPWSMVEVFLLGMLVAMIKISGMLEVHLGIGLWSMAALCVLVIGIAGRGMIYRLWDELS